MGASDLPIGVFDSGIGGLTVVKQLKKILPKENIVYLGDTARVPYGTRSKKVIEEFALEDLRFLLKRKVKCVVVACNTVSALALKKVKDNSSMVVFGMINPANAKALKTSKNKKIGLVGTRATVGSNAYKNIYMKRHASLLVPLVEEGITKGPELDIFIKKYFKDFKGKVDTLILGCTHYPIIKKSIEKYLGQNITLVDPAEEIAKEVKKYLKDNNLLNIQKMKGKTEYHLTDLNPRFLKTANNFLGNTNTAISFKQVAI
ncbi:glutamate racemase [Candidatus Microgenomates bacterium]|nr:glutamate racemase [Candidatus Microgenomates bacterium]